MKLVTKSNNLSRRLSQSDPSMILDIVFVVACTRPARSQKES